MSFPKTVTVPLPENLRFIDRTFLEAKLSTDNSDHQMDFASWPGMIGDDLIHTLGLLSLETAELIYSVIKPKIGDKTVHTPKDLTRITHDSGESFREYFVIDGDMDDFSDEQLQAFLLIGAQFEKIADWRKIARYYNDAPDDQKLAINTFFWEFRRLGLESLMSKTGLALPMPDALLSKNTKTVDGEVFVHCNLAKDWVRDDLFYRQYKISSTNSISNTATTIAYAGTLEQAIARATQFALSKNGPVLDKTGKPKVLSDSALNISMTKLSINLDSGSFNTTVSTADLVRNVKVLPDSTTVLDCKLSWGPGKSPVIREKAFRSALYATEKLFGVQWSKVHNLENELGL